MIVIVGVATVAMMQLLGTGSAANAGSLKLTTGLNLAGNVQEYVQTRTFAQSLALHGQTYAPPIDARGSAVAGMDGWSQSVNVSRVDEGLLTLNVPATSTSRTARVTVGVFHRGEHICTLRWLIVEAQ